MCNKKKRFLSLKSKKAYLSSEFRDQTLGFNDTSGCDLKAFFLRTVGSISCKKD